MEKWQTFYKKFKRKSKIWVFLFLEEAKAPIFDRSGFLQFLAFPFILYFAFSEQGLSGLIMEISNSLTFMQAILYAIPLYFIFCAIKAILCVQRKEKELGKWVKNEFIYNEPKLVFTTKITNSDNNKLFTFKIPDSEPNGYVSLRIEKDGWDTNTKATIIRDEDNTIMPYWDALTINHNFICSITPKSKKFHLLTMKENQNPCIIRVYMLSFSI